VLLCRGAALCVAKSLRPLLSVAHTFADAPSVRMQQVLLAPEHGKRDTPCSRLCHHYPTAVCHASQSLGAPAVQYTLDVQRTAESLLNSSAVVSSPVWVTGGADCTASPYCQVRRVKTRSRKCVSWPTADAGLKADGGYAASRGCLPTWHCAPHDVCSGNACHV
jgi:hypothetical protein